MRKLDALVAEKVMELQPVHLLGQTAIEFSICETGYFFCSDGLAKAKSYSTSIVAAWDVVEKFKNTHTWSIENDQGEINEWIVQLVEIDAIAFVPFHGEAPVASLAICLAALKACGVSEGEIKAACGD